MASLLTPGSSTRALVDNVSNSYQSLRNCLLDLGLVGLLACRGDYNDVSKALSQLVDYFTSGTVMANLIEDMAPGSTTDQRLDNSRFLFHPNAIGQGIMACNLSAAYNGLDQSSCTPNLTGVLQYLFNGSPLTSQSPIVLTPGAPVPFEFNGFDPGAPVNIEVRSAGVPLGSVVPDAQGEVQGSITLPSTLAPGVHQVEFSGTNNGSPRSIDVLVSIPGRAEGGTDYGTYVCCFPNDSQVDVTFAGFDWGVTSTDEDGGVFVNIPLPNPATPATIPITVTGLTTGATQTETIDPAPTSAAVWARGSTPSAVTITGHANVFGWVHSDGGIQVAGGANQLTGGVEDASGVTVSGGGNTLSPAPVTTAAGGSPVVVNPADFAPGGAIATSLGSAYHAVAASACVNGTWTASLGQLPSGVVFVPCGVTLSGPGTSLTTTIVALGPIVVDASHSTLTPAYGGLSLVGGSSVTLSGSQLSITGAVWAETGFTSSGSLSSLGCGVYAATVTISGSSNQFKACPSG